MEVCDHIVEFDIYCPKCKFEDKKDNEDPCNTCLGMPTNEHSKKPWYFEQKEVKKKKKSKKG